MGVGEGLERIRIVPKVDLHDTGSRVQVGPGPDRPYVYGLRARCESREPHTHAHLWYLIFFLCSVVLRDPYVAQRAKCSAGRGNLTDSSRSANMARLHSCAQRLSKLRGLFDRWVRETILTRIHRLVRHP